MESFVQHESMKSQFITTPLIGLLAIASPVSAQDPARWGDLGDGTYSNPVLPADFSDIDAIRVGDDFVAMSSTFQYSPGVVLLKSKDLVNWKIAGHAVPDIRQIAPEMNWDRMDRYGRGIWAGAIRHHAGKFWIYFGTPEEGYFMTTAPAIEGPWEPLTHVFKASGWDDCCPFWDDDGQMYLIGTQFSVDPSNGRKYNIHLWKLTPDGKALVPDSDRIIHQSQGSEANKLYKINGGYYHYYSEVKAEGRVVMMKRAKSLDGPWETKQLNHAAGHIDPNQGGLIELPDGTWWFFTHMGTGMWAGRTAHLLPVTWTDGWPIIGNVGADGIGNMAWFGNKPIAGKSPSERKFSDDFSGTSLTHEWEWNYHPRDDKWSLTERPGFLRLHAFKQLQRDNILKTGNCLTQRVYQSGRGEVTVKLDVSRMTDGQSAGLCFYSKKAGWIGVTRENGVIKIVQVEDHHRAPGPALTGTDLWLRAAITSTGEVTWSHGSNGKDFTTLGAPHQCDWANYRGTRIGIFTCNNDSSSGSVDIDGFSYAY
jgi:beta-xylosidase